MTWTVYILRCKDGVLCSGKTEDIENLVEVSNSGKGPVHTRLRLPVELVWSVRAIDKVSAMQLEYEVKLLTKVKKLQLIEATDLSRFISVRYIAPAA